MPEAGWIPIAIHRPIAGKIKNVTVSTVTGGWFVSAQTALEAIIPANSRPAVGIDIGGVQSTALSGGTVFGIARPAQTELRDWRRLSDHPSRQEPRVVVI
ncbi:hypothetical protein CV770_22490 [Bradyrhizobium sp. AC87j1]|nr:hypothetical protein CV770_22490 [Bradyrhizobium sp. AC87j1]